MIRKNRLRRLFVEAYFCIALAGFFGIYDIVNHRFHGQHGRFFILKSEPEHFDLLPAG